ncbi:MAG: DUF6491 family protein [Alphaproteobacteria bacterium]
MTRLTFSAFAVSILLAACAQTDTGTTTQAAATATEGKECFWLREVSGFNRAGRNQIFVHTGPNERFLFETLGPCPNLNFSETLAFEQRGPGQICRGLDVNLIVGGNVGPGRCPVKMIKKMTKEEAAAHKAAQQQ